MMMSPQMGSNVSKSTAMSNSNPGGSSQASI